MLLYLLDTDTLLDSLIGGQETDFSRWLAANPDGDNLIAISSVIIGHAVSSIANDPKLSPQDAFILNDRLDKFCRELRQENKIFDIDDNIARTWGRIRHVKTQGKPPGTILSLFIATAITHHLTILGYPNIHYQIHGVNFVDIRSSGRVVV